LLFLLGLILSIYPMLTSIKDSLAQERLRVLLQDYQSYLDALWFSGAAYLALLTSAIFMGLGGILAEKGSGPLSITLSLPAKRWQWTVTNAGMTALLIAALALAATVGLVLGSLFIGKSYPLDLALLGLLGLWLACFPWIGLSLLLNSMFHSDTTSGLILVPAGVIGPQLLLITSPSLYRWCPSLLARPGIWRQSLPWESLLVSIAVGLAGAALAALRFTREEC